MDGPHEAHRHRQFLIWSALSAALGIVAICLAVLGSLTPSHTPPPFEFGKLGGPPFSARDQP